MAQGVFTYKQLAEFWGMPKVGDANGLNGDISYDQKGEPIYTRRTVKGGDLYAKDSYGRWLFMPVKLGGVDLWLPLTRITGRKKIVETDLVERRGSVKEIIAVQNYLVSIRGIIKRPDNSYPDQELDKLRELYEKNASVPLQCAMTDIFLNSEDNDGYDHVVITSLHVVMRPGFPNAVGYELEMVEDNDFLIVEPIE